MNLRHAIATGLAMFLSYLAQSDPSLGAEQANGPVSPLQGVLPPAVSITEFMAANQNTLNDEDGASSDWIEIYNAAAEPVNLEGWYLTDTRANLVKWRFPFDVLQPKDYLVVFASGKNRAVPGRQLHTSFSLKSDGEYLGLIWTNGLTIVSEFAPTYPPQQTDVSYGRDAADPSRVGYFQIPSPGVQNTTSGAGFALSPAFSLGSGIYTNDSLTLTVMPAPGTTVRYTTDATIPTSASALYSGPLGISSSMRYKFRAFPSDTSLFPSPVVSRFFVLLDATARDFTSKLSILVMNTYGQSIPQNVPPGGTRPQGSFVVIDTLCGQASLQGKPVVAELAAYEIFGQSSAGFPKQPFNVEIQDELGDDKTVSVLGMPAASDWKLKTPYADKSLLNEFLALELFEQMGHYSLRRRLVEAFVKTGNGQLSWTGGASGDYYGVLVLLEKLERGKNRVNIAELTPTQNSEPDISGGYVWKKDKDSTGDLNFSTSGGNGFPGQALKIHEPKPRDITTAQLNWLRNYLNAFEQSIYADDWLTRTGTNHYTNYIDVDSFVDQHWIVEFSKQIDGYRLNNYMQKDRGGKIKMEPIWDWNLSFGNADYLEGGKASGWYWAELGVGDHIWARRMLTGTTSATTTTGDPDFVQKVRDRWSMLRTNIMNGERVQARISELGALLDKAAVRDNARFPRWGTYIWPNPSGPPAWDVDYQHPTTYAEIINQMNGWVDKRFKWIDTQIPRAPEFSSYGGNVTAGFPLSINSPVGGTIYYTLDGSDPRLPGGGVNPSATAYCGSIMINNNARVFARAKVSDGWSGPIAATFVVSTPPLVITEIMYHPADPPLSSNFNDDQFEFLELMNAGSTALQLEGTRFTEGISLVFSNQILAPLARVVVVRNPEAFVSRYGPDIPIAGTYEGALGNEGESLTLVGRFGEPIFDFSYSEAKAAYPATDGHGLLH
jgi:CotH kinase protein/Lamin Tail Domain/Chitobiase/beta-hexosaminidase C-terminal domain/Fn3 associated